MSANNNDLSYGGLITRKIARTITGTSIDASQLIDWQGDTGVMGCIDGDQYGRNSARAQRDGLPSCAHCGRGVNIERGYRAHATLNELFLRCDVTDEQADEALTSEGHYWVLLGSECAKNLPAAFRVKASEVAQ